MSIGATLRLDDGTMRRTVEDAAASIDPDRGGRRAPDAGVSRPGLRPRPRVRRLPHGHLRPSAYASACADLGVRFIYRGVEPHHVFDSLHVLSISSTDDLAARTAHFVDWLERLDDGVHFVMSHPAVASDELRAISDASDDNAVWAEPWRVADLAAVTDRVVRDVVERRGIELVSVADL